MEGAAPSSSAGNLVYRKLLPGCQLSDEPIEQSDFDLTLQYIKKCFPKAIKLQRDVEQTLKRTFVLEKSERKRRYLSKKIKNTKKEGSNRKTRMRKERGVPRSLNYESFLQLNTMWKSYIADLLHDEERPDEIQQKLNKIDLHGAMLTVADANCKDYVGLGGVVVKETRNIFIIVTSSGTTKCIPKAENMFDISLDNTKGTLKICGNSFLTRPAERASKKIKSFMEFIGARVYKSRLRYTWPK